MSEIKVDTVAEKTSANGVTVDGLNIKDSKLVTANSVVASNITADAIDGTKIADNAIDSEHYTDASIDAAHLNADVITGATALTAEPADTDEFLISDAGTLKRIDYSLIKSSPLFTKTAGVDISAGGSVTLQNCFNSTYDNYFITFSRIRNAADAQCFFRPINSAGNGTATNAYTGLFYGQGFSNNFYGTDQTDVKLNENCGTAAGEALSGFMYFFNPFSTGESIGQYTWQLASSHNGATNRFGVTWGGGVIGGTTSYTGFTVLFSTGNINSGEIAVYGIVNPV